MDLQLNATRRSINLSVYLVFDLEAGRFKSLGENLLGAGRSKMSFLPLTPSGLTTCSKSQRKTHQIAQIHHFVMSKQLKWKT